jgi:hypothetical protein
VRCWGSGGDLDHPRLLRRGRRLADAHRDVLSPAPLTGKEVTLRHLGGLEAGLRARIDPAVDRAHQTGLAGARAAAPGDLHPDGSEGLEHKLSGRAFKGRDG